MKVEIRDAILLLESEITQLVFNKIKEDPESGRKIDVAWKNIKNLLESQKEQATPKQTSPKFGSYRIPTSTKHRENELLRSLYFGVEGIDYYIY